MKFEQVYLKILKVKISSIIWYEKWMTLYILILIYIGTQIWNNVIFLFRLDRQT